MARWLVLGFVALTACYEAPRAPPTEEELSAFCREREIAHCEHSKACGLRRPSFDCSQKEPSSDCFSQSRQSLMSGVLFFNRDAARECLEETRTRSCSRLDEVGLDESCAQVVFGEAREGERCGACGKGLHCSVSPENACGTCVRIEPDTSVVREPIPDGEACDPTRINCDWRSYCARTAGDGGVCTPRVEAGASCESAVCTLWAKCTNRSCVALGEPGASCDGVNACHRDLFCDEGVCVPRRLVGAACATNDQCEALLCVDGVCRNGQLLGGTCGSHAFCQFDSRCVVGVCVALPSVGEPCADGLCASGAKCLNRTCVDPLVECR